MIILLVISIASGRKRDWCFTCEFEGLVLKFKEGKSPVSPIGIVSKLKSIGGQLGHGRQEDAHEFLRWYLVFHLLMVETFHYIIYHFVLLFYAFVASYLIVKSSGMQLITCNLFALWNLEKRHLAPWKKKRLWLALHLVDTSDQRFVYVIAKKHFVLQKRLVELIWNLALL